MQEFVEQICQLDPLATFFESEAGEQITFEIFAKHVVEKSQALSLDNQDVDVFVNARPELINIAWLMAALMQGRNAILVNFEVTYPEFKGIASEAKFSDFFALFSRINPDGGVTIETSGTTGKPKQIYISFPSLCYQALAVSRDIGLSREDRQLFYMPLNYVYGLSIFFTSLITGSCLVFSQVSVKKPKAFFDQLLGRAITVFSGVPYTYLLFAKYWGPEKLKGSSVRLLTQAGGKLDPATKQKILAALESCEFWIMYGQTEFGGRISQYRYMGSVPSAVGHPIKGTRVLILKENDDGTLEHFPSNQEEVGRVYVYSPSISISSDAHRVLYEDCYYVDTGDRGFFSGNMLHIVGRNSGFVKVGGTRVNLSGIESVFKQPEKVLEAVVTATEIPYPAILVGVYIDGEMEFNDQRELKEYLTRSNTHYADIIVSLPKVPIYAYQIRGNLPTLPSGKVNLVSLRERLLKNYEKNQNFHLWM